MSYTARIAEEKDSLWIEEVAAVNMLCEKLLRPELVNPQRIRELVHKGITEKTCFIAEKDGEPVGVLGAFLTSNLFNPDIKVLGEVFWYVLPEYRNTRAGILLFKLFDATAKEIADEATLSILIASSEINVDSLEKRGFKLNEFAFTRRY
jgi:hypothetical protein